MDDVTRRTKEAFEPKLRRPMTDDEAADFAMHMRRFAAFLIDCAKDEALMNRLGLKREEGPSAGRRVADNTSQNSRKPLRARTSAKIVPPTGAPSRDVLPHRDPSASTASAAPAGQPATPEPIQRVTTGATIDGSL